MSHYSSKHAFFSLFKVVFVDFSDECDDFFSSASGTKLEREREREKPVKQIFVLH